MKRIIVFGASVCTMLWSYGQTGNAAEIPAQQQKLDKLKGTYELKSDTREKVLLPSALADIIEKNRRENEISTVRINEHVELVIYPRNKIKEAPPAGKQ